MTSEAEIVRGIADGTIASPAEFMGMTYFAVRISGTGEALRPKYNERVFRDPTIWLTDRMAARCIGLPVLSGGHLANDAFLDGSALAARCVGTIVHPFIDGDELCGVARIFDAATATEMATGTLDTSPGVAFTEIPPAVDGLVTEPAPRFLDHLALVSRGTWSRGAALTGIRITRKEPTT